ncbi:2-amino-4-hydroxy-6-hydroxymethyldihydropteridine diphosphokinase [Nesterenkonia ebinurensis]|uniref:2-amino-4-hydroxy-6- hydroxymethyldihydropteridine diphosphokinase n=1 Tax=Nesterenkonia ebinurensis TaxID=2608252 RepID=UPI00123E3887|nr:2-amino-4-hydroxy-6-hydroxymethyldihydropteridine diphosphokinase [Nesterenkonia ebinurensis]
MGYDLIRLTGLRFEGTHGVLPDERSTAQPFVIDAEVQVDLAAAGRTDNLEDTISYADVAFDIEQVVTGESYRLIERIAAECAARILGLDDRIQAVTITVHKPQAPMPYEFDDVSVIIHRTRDELGASRALGEPRKQVSGVYEGELVEDNDAATPASAHSAASPPEGATVTTPTAGLGYYERKSLADLGEDGEAAKAHYRDPDLEAAFPVRSVLALGSNLGDSRSTLASAIQVLEAADGVVIVSTSPLARTKPMGGPAHQRDYLNQVVEIETQLSPHGLLDLAQQIEEDHNRVREQRHGPRTLDVDIVTYASATIDSPRLQVPHPSAAERAFVLLPWSWMDPVALLGGRPVRELAEEAEDYSDVVRLDS